MREAGVYRARRFILREASLGMEKCLIIQNVVVKCMSHMDRAPDEVG